MKNFLNLEDIKNLKENSSEEEILAYIEFRQRQVRKLMIEIEELTKILHKE